MTDEIRDMEYRAGYKNLTVYEKAHDLVLMIYKITQKFPKEEIFGLTSQARRCAVSVPANIVEGYGRHTLKDKGQFYYIARGSLNELEYYLDLAKSLEYIAEKDYKKAAEMRSDVGKLLSGLIKSTQP